MVKQQTTPAAGDGHYVVVIGGANIDIHGTPARKLLAHDSNPGKVVTSPGGVARNIAENLARLGVDCRLVSVVGMDPHGTLLLEQGRVSGIDMQHVMQAESSRTSTYLSILDETGDMHVAISDMEIIEQLGPEHMQNHEQLLRDAALIVLDTNLSDDCLAWLTDNFSDRKLFVDTVSTTKAIKIKQYLGAVHTLKPSLNEARAIAGNMDGPLPDLADWFHAQGVRRLFITLGQQGVFFSETKSRGTLAPPECDQKVRNAGGAGDAFLAGLAYAWLNQWQIEKTVGFAMAAAGVTLQAEHTNNPELSLAVVTRIYEASYAK